MTRNDTMNRRTFLSATSCSLAGAAIGSLGTLAYQRWYPVPEVHEQVPRTAPAEPAGFNPSLALSLRVLQEELRSGRGSSRDHARLGGMNRIRCITIEAENEVLLLGDRVAGGPEIQLDDLVIALRNAYRVGPPYELPPGCTIDPREGADDPWRIQEVKVFGMPHSAHMGARYVAVDYELKRAGAGIVTIKEGMQSLYELGRLSSSPCQGAEGEEESSETVHRFWFFPRYPERPRFLTEQGAVWIQKPVEVQLLTEQEFLDRTGRRVGAAAADPLAARFAGMVTQLLATDEVPQYVSLRKDFRVVEAGKLIEYLRVPSAAFGFLLQAHALGTATVPTYVGGIWRDERGELVCDNSITRSETPTGTLISSNVSLRRYHRRIRGGVEVRIELSPEQFAEGSGDLATLRQRVLKSRPSPTSLLWEISA